MSQDSNNGEKQGKIKVGILGSGNIGTDLMYKLLERPGHMEVVMLAGIDPDSDGLGRARSEGVGASHHGVNAIAEDPEIEVVFEATSAKAHLQAAEALAESGKVLVDMTPSHLGPFVVPPVNLTEHLEAADVNMISCGGQASIPLINAIAREAPVAYAELISANSSSSVGPGTRQNIDEFTFTTADAMEAVGHARKGRALPIINPAEPPIIMSNTVYAVIDEEDFDREAIVESIESVVTEVQKYVPGYRLKAEPTVERREGPWGNKPTFVVLNQVEGAGDYFPTYAGNLDIMTASAWRVGEIFARRLLGIEELVA